ncbi:MAG TPA: hypothetical protein VJN89_00110 [Candidatus Acidoferrum sp.]|nr:hypothetical protein [Candidatus Acidoferrum sp.]
MPILFREIFCFENFENKISIEKVEIYGESPPLGDWYRGKTRKTIATFAYESPLAVDELKRVLDAVFV